MSLKVRDDLLNGGVGNDAMFGGLGNDRYYVDSALDVVDETGGAGVDTVLSTISYTLADNIENLSLQGTANINGTGNTLDNTMTGNSGANRLDGGVGNDTLGGLGGNDLLIGGLGNDRLLGGLGADNLRGGGGNDIYYVDNAGDDVSEAGGSGGDTVFTTVSFTLPTAVEKLVLAGTGNIDGTGNALVNRMQGNIGANVLDGAGGNDIINGGLGADTVKGGDGNDVLIGDSGNDHLTGGAGVDKLIGGTGNDVLDVGDGAGLDTVAFAPGSGSDVVNGFDNSLLGAHDLLDVSAFGYTNFADFVTGGGLILPNLVGGLLTSYTVKFSFAGEQAIVNVTDLLGPAISPSDFKFA
jgi:Ca2+-binding RTX toxin-like protein